MIRSVEEIYNLKKTYYESLDTFKNLVNNYRVVSTYRQPLYDYVQKFHTEYFINMSDTRKLISDDVEGNVKEIKVRKEDRSLIISVTYINDIQNCKDVLRLSLDDRVMLDYFYYSIKIFLKKNFKRSSWGTGSVIDIVMKAVKIFKLEEQSSPDKNRIGALMTEFYKSSSTDRRSLSELEMKIDAIQEELNRATYKCYNLSENEIDVIEKYIEEQVDEVSRSY